MTKVHGSFTGIRIGISTIKAISEVHNIPIIGVTSLKSLSFNEITKNILTENVFLFNNEDNVFSLDNTIISLIDARNNQVYCGVFNKDFDDIYLASDINEILGDIKKYIHDGTIFVGNASIMHKELIKNRFEKSISFSEYNEQSSVSTAIAGLEIFKNGVSDTADTILPFYLRKSQAERMKDLSNNGNV